MTKIRQKTVKKVVLLSMKQQRQQTVNHRLVQEINQQGVPPQNREPRQADVRQGRVFRPQAVEMEARPEQQQPRQQGEVVRGHKARGGKAQPGGEEVGVPALRQGQQGDAGKAQKAVVYVPQHQKQPEADGQPQPGRDAVQ